MKPDTTITITDTPLELAVDAEHIGVRTAIPLLAVLGVVGGIILGSVIAPQIDEALSTLCVSLILAVVGLVTFTYFGERLVKRFWTSGRTLLVDLSQITLLDKRKKPTVETTLHWPNGIGIQAWYFIVTMGRSRVQKGWYCVSLRLLQRDQSMIIYTFLSPETAQSLEHFTDWFVHLRPRQEREDLSVGDPHFAAQQERFRRLESHRFYEGAELAAEDFLAVIELVNQHGSRAPDSA